MKVEILIYCYGAVCLSMIIFNFLCIFVFKGRDIKALRQSRNFIGYIEKQLSLVEQGQPLSEKEYKFLIKRLRKAGNLVAFDKALEEFYIENRKMAEMYIKSIHRVILFLSTHYLKKESIQSAFFLSFINKYKVTSLFCPDYFTEIIMEYFKKPSVYCNLNAMEALYLSGQTQSVIQGLKILNVKESHFHSKLIVRGLRMFKGNAGNLAKELISEFDFFSVLFKTAIVDYLSSLDCKCDEFVFSLLTNPKEDNEIRYSAIRYFGRHIYNPAYPVLCDMASNLDTSVWVYTSQSISTLSKYPGEKTVNILKAALYSANWYVRYNAAEALEKLGITYNELSEIINGNDRYAREIITYRSEHNGLIKRQVALS